MYRGKLLIELCPCRSSCAVFSFCLSSVWCFFVAASSSRAQDIDIKPLDERIKLDDAFRAPPGKAFPLSEILPRQYAPGELRVEYHGIRSLILRRMQSYYNRFANKSIQDFYANSNLTPAELDALMAKYWCRDSNVFWNRNWLEARSIEQGGAGETVVFHIGETQDIFRVSAFALNNEGKITTGDIRLLLDTIRSPPPEPGSPETPPNIRKVAVVSGLQVEEIYRDKAQRYEISVRPNLSLRFTTKSIEIINQVSLEFKLKLFSSHSKAPMLAFSVQGQYSPAQNYGMGSFLLELGIW